MTQDLGATLATLKHKIETSRDFHDPWSYFGEEFAAVSSFIAVGQRAAHPQLSLCLSAIGGHLSRKPCSLPETTEYIHIPEHDFWHGYCSVGGYLVICFFFNDIVNGLAGFKRSVFDPDVDLVRLRWIEVPQDRPAWGGVAGRARHN